MAAVSPMQYASTTPDPTDPRWTGSTSPSPPVPSTACSPRRGDHRRVAENAVLAAVLWPVLIIAVFAPLSVRPSLPGHEPMTERVVPILARQGDARGDTARAIAVLDVGLDRHADRVPLLAYRAELLLRAGHRDRAAAAVTEIDALDLDTAARGVPAAVAELRQQLTEETST